MAAWKLAPLGALVLLAACGKGDVAAPAGDKTAGAGASAAVPSGKGGAAAKSTAATAAATNAKYNKYVEAHNKLVGTFGLSETFDRYRQVDYQKIKPTANISFTDGWVHLARDSLKEGRALAAPGLEALDKAADSLLPELDKLVAQLKELDAYYESRAYRQDGMAKGRQMDPLVVAGFEATRAAAARFDAELDKVDAERTKERLAKLKAEGDEVGYFSALALSQAEPIVNLFGKASDLKDPATLGRAETMAAALEKTIAEERAAYAKAKSQAESSGGSVKGAAQQHESIADSLTTLVGNVRDLKASRSASDHKRMVDNYNRAVDHSNRP